MADYDEEVDKFPTRRLTGRENAQARYGFRVNERRAIFRGYVSKYFRWVGGAVAAAAAASEIWKAWHG